MSVQLHVYYWSDDVGERTPRVSGAEYPSEEAAEQAIMEIEAQGFFWADTPGQSYAVAIPTRMITRYELHPAAAADDPEEGQ